MGREQEAKNIEKSKIEFVDDESILITKKNNRKKEIKSMVNANN